METKFVLQLQDLEKLQKEAEMYQKENERLQAEVRLLKQELEGAEQAALATSMTQSQLGEQMQRVQELEEERAQLSDECSELREQNELLEFRILELEDDNDKVRPDPAQIPHSHRAAEANPLKACL